jgi:hypothetical protein
MTAPRLFVMVSFAFALLTAPLAAEAQPSETKTARIRRLGPHDSAIGAGAGRRDHRAMSTSVHR